MTTNKNLFNDWGAKLLAWTTLEAGETGNKNLTTFCNATNLKSLFGEERLQMVLSTPEIMALAVTENKKIVVLHSMKNLGGTLICPKNKVVALLGISHDAKAVELIVESAFKSYKLKLEFKEATICQESQHHVLPFQG